jgi:PiT family inorganic phosphate transporter
MTLALITLGGVLVLAFFNGANGVSKGIATLVGSGVTRLRTAVVWGTVWTVAGALAAAFASHGLVKAFSGSGVLSPLPEGDAFVLAVATGALLWVGFATWTGMPVSTTHAITGALVGAGLVAVSAAGIHWPVLAQKFLLPLAGSPLLSLALMFVLFPLLDFVFGRLRGYCVCTRQGSIAVVNQSAALAPGTAGLAVGTTDECARDASAGGGLNLMDACHWASAGATSFARGLNDAPKILALGLVANFALGWSAWTGFVLVAVAMGVGSLIAGFRVTETLAQKVTRMAPNEGFIANLITAALVICASRLALPISTTHVSSGALIGLGLKRDARGVRWQTVLEMLLAWVVTLPTAALFAALVYWSVTAFG